VLSLSTTSPLATPAAGQPGPRRAATAGPQPEVNRHSVRRRLLTMLVLAACGVTVLLAVPDLHPIGAEIADMNPALVGTALALELASCLSFVVIFRRFFGELPAGAARELAWTQMGSGALLPGGGVGSLAVGGWLLHLIGMPTGQILKRSSGLFFLTSAINVITLAAGGAILLTGLGHGPHDLLRGGLPILAAAGAVLLVLGAPMVARRFAIRAHGWLDDIGAGVPAARNVLAHPGWRLLGAFGYLLFDIAVLWTALAAVGAPPPVGALILAYLLGYLANAIPLPGGIGVLDAGLVGALTLYGLPLTHAAAAVLVYHAIAFWIPTVGGALGYLRVRRRLEGEAGPSRLARPAGLSS
jgi:uncharacterized membrane protein YbhN (UPF0104 family)